MKEALEAILLKYFTYILADQPDYEELSSYVEHCINDITRTIAARKDFKED